jgi:PAS domain S-box-containing protein
MSPFELIAYPLLPVSAMELLLGFLLLTQNRRNSPINRSVAAIAFFSAAFSLNTSIMYLMAFRGHDFNLFARLNWIGWFAIPAGLQFLFYFRSETSLAARRTGYIIYPFWAIVLALCLFTDLIVTPGYSLIPYRDEPGPLEIPARVAGTLMTLWLMVGIVRVRRQLTGIKKFQLNLFFYGLLIYAFAGVTIAGIMPAIKGDAIEPGLGSYFSLPWVALTFYAIVRHSLFEVRIIFSRIIAIIILVLACSVLQLAVLAGIAPALGPALSIFVSLSLLGFFLFGTPVSRSIQSLVDSLIIGDRYQYETSLREAIVTLNAKKEGQELIEYVIGTTCAALGITDAGIYLHRIKDGFLLREGTGLFQAMKNRGSLADIAVKKLRETNQSLILAEMFGAGEDHDIFHLTTYLRGIGAEAVVPLFFGGQLRGAMILGRKVNGEPFGQSDIRFLETLAAHAASALENARLDDITRKIRSSLQESEERFMTLAQGMPAAVFIHQGASIVYANAAAEDMTGYSSDRLKTMSISDLLQPEPGRLAAGNSPGRFEPQARPSGKEVRMIQENGDQRWAVMTSAAIEYGEQAAVISILFDVTDHKRTEGRMRYDRMRDAVRRMASYFTENLERLAEDLRQVETLQEYGDEGQGDPQSTMKIRSTRERVEMLVRTVREFSTKRVTNRTLQDINQVVAARQTILVALLTGKYELVVRRAPEPLKVMVDPGRIESALMNLVLNAREQMQRGGVVTIATGHAVIDADFIRQTGYGRVGRYATVTVSDAGEGVSEAEQERIFEPFFMTKSGWLGNGMGLSTVYDIVKEHEGYITITSRPGQGTSFKTYLPLVT